MRVCRNDTVLLTGGADGVIKRWNIMDGNLVVRVFGLRFVLLSANMLL